MARRTGIEFDGLAAFRRDLKRMGGDIADLKEANLAAGAIVAAAAAARAPRRSGRLAASIRPAKTVSGAVVRSASPYAGPIHWGWPARNIQGQPFIADAAEATEAQWLPLYLESIERAVAKIEGNTY